MKCMFHVNCKYSTASCCLCIIQMRKIIIWCFVDAIWWMHPQTYCSGLFFTFPLPWTEMNFQYYPNPSGIHVQIPGFFNSTNTQCIQHAIDYIVCFGFGMYPLNSLIRLFPLSWTVNMNRTWFVCLGLLFVLNL